MIQLCRDSVRIPLAQIFKFSLRQGVFPDTWKMAKIILVHKKEAKYLVKIYRPINILPVFLKFLKDFNLILLSPIFMITIY